MEKQELQLLERFERDSKWFHEHTYDLRKENFTNKFVAILDEKPIASDENLEVVIKSVEKKGENASYVFIEFVHPKGFILLL